MKKQILTLTCLVFSLSNCNNMSALGTTHAAIVNGEASGDRDQSVIVIGFQSGNAIGECTGILVAPNLVLTARHCVSDLSSEFGGICDDSGNLVEDSGGTIAGDRDPAKIIILVGSDAKTAQKITAKKIFHDGADYLCNNDIAMILLEKSASNPVIAPLRLNNPPVVGESLLAVGWGVANDSKGFIRRRRDNIPILAVGPIDEVTKYGPLPPREFITGEDICSGDSGGPLFSSETGAVVGISSKGGNGYPFDPDKDPRYAGCVDKTVDGQEFTTRNYFTRVDSFRTFILGVFAEAGATPVVEQGALGANCTTNDECASKICAETSAKFCAEPCPTVGEVCGIGYTCRDVKGQSLCSPDKFPSLSGGGCEFAANSAAPNRLAWLLAVVLFFLLRRRTRALT